MREWSPFRAYAARRGRSHWQDGLTASFLVAGCLWFFLEARHLPPYEWNWQACARFFCVSGPQGEWQAGLLLQGLFTTLRVGFWSFLLALIAGGAAGLYAVSKSFWDTLPYQIFINLLRNTPPLVILFCVYFLTGSVIPVSPMENAIRHLPPFMQEGIASLVAAPGQMDRMLAAVLALGLYQGAYVAEIVRGSMQGVGAGQWDAGLALGFGRLATLRLIILPQGLRLALAPLTGQCISTFKESALASLISLPDLTFQSLEIMAISGMTFEVWICAGLLYLLLGLACGWLGRLLELRCAQYAD